MAGVDTTRKINHFWPGVGKPKYYLVKEMCRGFFSYQISSQDGIRFPWPLDSLDLPIQILFEEQCFESRSIIEYVSEWSVRIESIERIKNKYYMTLCGWLPIQSRLSSASHLCWNMHVGKQPTAMMAVKRLASVAPEVDVRKCTLCSPLQKAIKAEPTRDLKPRGHVIWNSKHRYQWPQIGHMHVSAKTFKKKSIIDEIPNMVDKILYY